MVGAGGFEPPGGGTKIRCLTTWLRPKQNFTFYNSSPATFLYSQIIFSSIILRVSAFKGCTISLKDPSFFLREGIETNKPLSLFIIFISLTIKQPSNMIVAYPLSLPSFAGKTFTSVISILFLKFQTRS